MSPRPNRLAVVLYGQLAGHIERNGGSITFTYDEDYLAGPRPTPLSLSMPLSATTYTNKWVQAHLKGLLPDNDEVRRRWARHFGLRDGDTFGLIAAIGSDAAGGAVFLPTEDYPQQLDTGHVEPIAEAGIADRLRRLRADDTDWLGEDEHWSLAGAQSKFTLRRTDNGWGIAHGTVPSTHIIKPGIGRIPAQALIEHVSMRAAASLGLDVANTSYTEFEDQPAIVVERFDRMRRGGQFVRVHQEDFCQTFGLNPDRKYEADRGPGVQKIADRLRDVTADDSVQRFARAVVVNYLLGAPDAHAKNYSILLVGPAARFAPLYDLATGLTVDRGDRLRYPKAAMSMGGERAFGEVHGQHWNTFARRVGLPIDQVRTWVKQTAADLPDAVSDALTAVQAPYASAPEVQLLLPRLQHLADLTTRALDTERRGRQPTGAGARALAAVRVGS